MEGNKLIFRGKAPTGCQEPGLLSVFIRRADTIPSLISILIFCHKSTCQCTICLFFPANTVGTRNIKLGGENQPWGGRLYVFDRSRLTWWGRATEAALLQDIGG